jgi:SH3 domain protein
MLLWPMLAWLAGVSAETSFVVDELLVGVHEKKNLDSAILKVLPTGTKLEVIERDGELALVEDPDKVRGWVDSAYLTSEQPAQLRLVALQKGFAALEARHKKLQGASAGASGNGEIAAEVNELTTENTNLKGKLSEERLRVGKFQSEIAGLRSQVSNNTAPPDARIVELQRRREKLEDALGKAEQQVAELSARSSIKATSALIPIFLKEYAAAILVGLLLIIALGFGAGVYVVDLLNRRRHGGFRV